MDKNEERMDLSTRFLLGGSGIVVAQLAWLLVARAWPWPVLFIGVGLIGALGLVGLAFLAHAALRRQAEQLRAWFLQPLLPDEAETPAPPRVGDELFPLVEAGIVLREMQRALTHENRRHQQQLEDFARSLMDFGREWTLEHDISLVLERILLEAKRLCHADAGTLYLRTDEDALSFAIVRNDSLGLAYGGSTGVAAPYRPLALRPGPNHKPGYGRHIACLVALSGKISNIPEHDTVSFIADNYMVNSLLTVPMKDS